MQLGAFVILAVLVVGSAAGLILKRNPIHGALFLVVLCVQLVAGGRAATTFATLATVTRSSPLPATRPAASTMIDGL